MKIEPEVSIFFSGTKVAKSYKGVFEREIKRRNNAFGRDWLTKKRLFKSCVVFFKVYTMSQSVVFSRV